MKIYNMPKSLSTTMYLLEQSESLNAHIVCSSKQEAEFIKEDALFFGKKIPRPVTVSEIKSGLVRPPRIIIKDLESFIENLTECITVGAINTI